MKRELRVGILFIVVVAALGFMLSRTANRPGVSGKMITYYTMVDDSSGLLEGTAVKVAGIRVGQLREKVLVNDRARLELAIAAGISVRRDAIITVRTIGYLGDRYLDLKPGSEAQAALREGAEIPAEIGTTLDQLMAQGGSFLDSWAEAGRALSKVLGGGGG